MSDDLNKKIQQIAELLGQENMPDNVKGLISMLAGSLGAKEEAQPKSEGQAEPIEEKTPVERPSTQDKPVNQASGLDQDMLGKMRSALERANPGNDPRVNLLHAIKPFMNGRRQKKISNCIQLLQMTNLTRMFNDHEK